ncbi:MAG: hypothetical protein KDE56_21405 [Anaerolineales bacterium]|nr:hypothetical protein [Anaerolineales bacterium]
MTTEWEPMWNQLPEPLLIIGNPPWVTNTQLGKLSSQNLPPKSNFKEQPGLMALMGSSNFDISEWLLLKLIEFLQQRDGLLAMLCKTAVIRRVLQEVWQNGTAPGTFRIHRFDSQAVFNVSVDACLFVYEPSPTFSFTCPVYQGLSSANVLTEIGYRNGQLVANAAHYDQWQHLQRQKGKPTRYQWRSGIKHDCAPVMELHKEGHCYVNKLGESYELESQYLYPLWKSSDVANGKAKRPFRWLLVPQQSVGESTSPIQRTAPKTWQYLQDHAPYFERRKSRIYQNRPRFSIFGVGTYTFAPWKVAISGLYKKLEFVVIEPTNQMPVVLDDTCYFLAAESFEEASLLACLLNSEPAREFFEALIFWEAKRPITATILNKLDLEAVAKQLGQDQRLAAIQRAKYPEHATQMRLLEESAAYRDSHSDC